MCPTMEEENGSTYFAESVRTYSTGARTVWPGTLGGPTGPRDGARKDGLHADGGLTLELLGVVEAVITFSVHFPESRQ